MEILKEKGFAKRLDYEKANIRLCAADNQRISKKFHDNGIYLTSIGNKGVNTNILEIAKSCNLSASVL